MNRDKPAYQTLKLHNLPFICLGIFFLIIPTLCEAQIELSHFTYNQHYTVENGLASTYTSEIEEDKNGFLWIATANGISRFDGNYFANYSYFIKDSISQKVGYITSIEMDASGARIWIGTNKGIYYSTVDTINFIRIDTLNHPENTSVKKSNDLLLDKDNVLWVASSNNGLWSFDLTGNQKNWYSFETGLHTGNTKLNSLQCIAEDPNDKNILWIGTLAGLIRFNTISKNYQVYVYEDNPEMAHNNIRKIAASHEEVILGTWHKGLVVFNKQSTQFSLPLEGEYPNSHLLILDIYKENDTSLWVTSADGLIQYDEQSKSATSVTEHDSENGLIRGVSYLDSRGIIWFTYGKGLFKYDPLQSQNTFVEIEKRNSIQNQLLVREIIRSGNFVYIVGQNSSGLYKLNLNDYSVETIKLAPLNYSKKTGYQIMDMVEMAYGNFVILSNNKLLIFNPVTRQVELASLQVDHPNPSLQTVIRDSDNNYWIGAREGGLSCLNFETHSIINYKDEFNLFRDENHRWINNLLIDSKNKLWIGKGFPNIIMNLPDRSVNCFDLNELNTVKSYTDVYEFYEDAEGRVWMAGASEGLGFADFENFENGLSHKVNGYFSGVYGYNDSLLWTTGKGLGVMNTHTMIHRDIKLSSNHKSLRITGPVIPAGNGAFIIGCDNGVLFYNPEKQQLNDEIPRPYIRAIESGGKTLYSGHSLTNNEFSFDVGTKQLILKISSLGFHFSDQIRYQYRIEGDWQNIGTDKEINLANLSYGKYKLQIRAMNNQGIGQDNPEEYFITIPSPWWVRWWAIILYLGLAVLFADRFYRFQLSKKLALAEAGKLKELSELRNSMYTNITHEFRTPLTVIKGMADSLKSNLKGKKSDADENSLEMIDRNSDNLLHLVNEMLDLAKIESGKMELQLGQADVIPFLKYICESFSALAEENQINVTVYSEIDRLIMDFDVDKLTAVMSNLLSNAIKFTPRFGKIIVHIKQMEEKDGPFLFIKIKDNGIGIPGEELPNIFNRFYQANGSSVRKSGGTGIGLALTKELVHLMNGTIEVKSKVDEGSEFSIMIPVTNQAQTSEDVKAGKVLAPSFTKLPAVYLENELDPNAELPLALIIEDNMDVAHYISSCLVNKYHTIHAVNGNEGIDMALEKIPDIIISDVMMPGKDGLEVCATLKSDERSDHIPIILLTAKATVEDRISGLSHGADAYLSKPFIKAELFTRLDQLVSLRKKLINKIQTKGFQALLTKKTLNPKLQFLQKVEKLIHEDISNSEFGSYELAKKLHISESQLYRKTKAITGKSTAVFIRSIRLHYAKELLINSDKTVSEVAYDAGFNDPSWFSRAFKDEFGMSPSATSN